MGNENELVCEGYANAFDCCDIEVAIGRILHELTDSGTLEAASDVVREYEDANQSFDKHQKLLESGKEEIQELERTLSTIPAQSEPAVKSEKLKGEPLSQRTDFTENLSFIKQLVDHKVYSKKEYYAHLFKKVKEKTKDFEREIRMQIHTDVQTTSFWLLKLEAYIEELDLALKTTFDDWALKKREIAILKKFRTFNLEKMKRVSEMIIIREEVIEIDRKEKEIESEKEKEESRKHASATLIQAYWRGTMVRKHLGPYKIKKKDKKGKGKKKGMAKKRN